MTLARTIFALTLFIWMVIVLRSFTIAEQEVATPFGSKMKTSIVFSNYRFSNDTSLRSCNPAEGGHLPADYFGSPMLSTSELRHSPPFPNWPSWHPGPCVIRDNVFMTGTRSEFAIHVNLWNRAKQIGQNLVQLLKLTRGAWELVLLDDGSTDDSLSVVHAVLDRYAAGWPTCDKDEADIDVNEVWPSGSKSTFFGALGVECIFVRTRHLSRLVRVRVLRTPIVGLLPTFGNNLQMRLTSSVDFHVIVDDDQIMSVPGWNEWLARPLQEFSDVFSVSARCAHGWPNISSLFGNKCADPGSSQRGFPWGLHVSDSGNRGPLILRGSVAHKLGYLDEINFAGHWTMGCDHDLNVRAFSLYAAVSGLLPVPYTQESCCRSLRDKNRSSEDAYHEWWAKRRDRGPPTDRFLPSESHNHFRTLNTVSPSWALQVN